MARIDEHREGVVQPSAADPHGADLDDPGRTGSVTRSLQVDDDELGLAERPCEQRVIADAPASGRLVEVEARVGLEQECHEVMREGRIAARLREHDRRQLIGGGARRAREQVVVETLPHAPTRASLEREKWLSLRRRAGRALADGKPSELRLELLELLALALLEELELPLPLLVERLERRRPLVVEALDGFAHRLHHAERRHGGAETEGAPEDDARLIV